MKRSMLMLLALGGCTVAEVDRAPAGTADHSVYVVNNERGLGTQEARFKRMDEQAAAAAAAKCGSMRVVELRRAVTNSNEMTMTFRCVPVSG
jgi:hypothetical protein